jgi:hypothetical protein
LILDVMRKLLSAEELGQYDAWNGLKKDLQAYDDFPFFPQEAEVWMAFVGKNLGFEQNGSGDNFARPVLIIKRFNNRMFWCVSLSTKQKDLAYYHNFIDPHGRAASAILAQLKLMSVKRLKRKLYVLSPEIFMDIREKIRDFMAAPKIETPL